MPAFSFCSCCAVSPTAVSDDEDGAPSSASRFHSFSGNGKDDARLLGSSAASSSNAATANGDHSRRVHSSATSASSSFNYGAASIRTIPSLSSLQLSSLVDAAADTLSSAATCHFDLLSSFPSTSSSSSASIVAISPSDPPLLYCASQSEIAVYDLTDLHTLGSFRAAGDGAVKSIAFSPDDSRVFTAHQDRMIRVWSSSVSSNHRLLCSLPTPADRLRRFALPRNYVAVRRHHRRLWIEHADAVSSLATAGGLLYSASWDKSLKVWRAASDDIRCLESVPAHDDAVNAVAVASDGTVYTASADRRIKVWATPHSPPPGEEEKSSRGLRRRRKRKMKHALVATLERHRSAVNALALSPDGSMLYSGACDRSIVVWEREESAGHMSAAGVLRGHAKAIMCLAAADDLIISGSTDRTVRIWQRAAVGGAGEYRCVAVLGGHRKGVRSVAAVRVGPGTSESPDLAGSSSEYRVCSASADGEVRVWRVRLSMDRGEDKWGSDYVHETNGDKRKESQ